MTSRDSGIEGFSGRMTLRIPPSLHEELVEAAAQEGVSLNTFMCAVLAAEIGWTTRTRRDAAAREQRRRENEQRRKEAILKEVWGFVPGAPGEVESGDPGEVEPDDPGETE